MPTPNLTNRAPLALALLMTCPLLHACGEDDAEDEGDAGASGPACGTQADPGTLDIGELTPALGASVENHDVVHSFTIVNAPGLFQQFALAANPVKHTAGLFEPMPLRLTAAPTGKDIVYAAVPLNWNTAPGHVEFPHPTQYTDSKGCVWVFPSPWYSYDITAAEVADAATGEADAE